MTDENGDTVTTFLPFSTLEEGEDNAERYEIYDDGADSQRVIGKVTDGVEKPSDGTETAEDTDTAESIASSSEGNTERSGANPIALVAGVATVAIIGGVGFYMTKKKK